MVAEEYCGANLEPAIGEDMSSRKRFPTVPDNLTDHLAGRTEVEVMMNQYE